ncbi:hypothetical protein [Amycolatopsis speibonae]|uniref:Uncharacterized protein n=1 Tax=Amycolatopsis speibonae TaxID=1450224 RepID=A0ABV7P7E3_9PSEU
MAIDTKYGRVTLENGTIGEDEPVFVLRGQDALAPEVLAEYRRLCVVAGSPSKHLDGIDAATSAVVEWQQNNRTQVPQSAG